MTGPDLALVILAVPLGFGLAAAAFAAVLICVRLWKGTRE